MKEIEGLSPEEPITLFDIDGTLTVGLTIYYFAGYLAGQGMLDQEAWAAMQSDLDLFYKSKGADEDYKSFALNLVDHYAQGLRGRSVSDITSRAEQFFVEASGGRIDGYRISSFSSELVDMMNKHTITIAVSGSPEESLKPLTRHLGISFLRATELKAEDGVYTGGVKVNRAIDRYKEEVVEQLGNQGYDKERSFAFGDSPHDTPLLEGVNDKNAFVIGNNQHLLDKGEGKWTGLKPEDTIPIVRARVIEVFGEDA